MKNPSTNKHLGNSNLKGPKPLFSYRLLLFILYPLTFLITVRDCIRRKGTMRYIKQRFGYGNISQNDNPIWLHAASVGELNAALPLLANIIKRQPGIPVLVTTSTATAARILKQKFPSLAHSFLPLDYTSAINRFLTAIQPRAAFIMETELWPNLFYRCFRRRIPIVIINGRISDKTFHCSAWQKNLYQNCLQQCSLILTRSGFDQSRFIKLGANTNNIKSVGNLKFSTVLPRVKHNDQAPLSKKYILAASTHHNEEDILCQCWQQLKRRDHLLVIAPRHPERRNAIIKQLRKLNIEFATRSCADVITDSTEVYLADTMGELMLFMKYAEFIFMGGSLIPHGGQNILEPGSLGKAIICGPHMQNFKDEFKQFKQHNAIQQVQNAQELMQALVHLLDNKDLRDRLGQAALRLVQNQQHIVDDYYKEIQPYLNSQANNSDQEE